MKNSWGHGKFVLKKRCPGRVLIMVRPVTIVTICSLFPPAKKIIESEITFLSWFKSEGHVCHWSLHHNGLSPCLYSLYGYCPPPSLFLITSASNPPDQYGPSNHLPHLIKIQSLPLWKASKGSIPKWGHADKTSVVCFAGHLHNRGW